MTEDTSRFLARWSRLKRVAIQPRAESATLAAGEPSVERVEAADEDDSLVAPGEPSAVLPSPDGLDANSDLIAFLRKGVPEELRYEALRRMWSLDPAIRDFVEIAENQFDWNVPGGAPGFGPLDAATNVAQLLETITTGSAKPPSAPAPKASPGTEAAASAVAVEEATPPSDPIVAMEEPAGPRANTAAQHDPIIVPRRRHGGALPT
jgi:hypothetical protein